MIAGGVGLSRSQEISDSWWFVVSFHGGQELPVEQLFVSICCEDCCAKSAVSIQRGKEVADAAKSAMKDVSTMISSTAALEIDFEIWRAAG